MKEFPELVPSRNFSPASYILLQLKLHQKQKTALNVKKAQLRDAQEYCLKMAKTAVFFYSNLSHKTDSLDSGVSKSAKKPSSSRSVTPTV